MTMITTAIVTVMTGTVMTGTVMTGTVIVTKRTIRSPGANGINNSARKPKKYTGKKDS